MGLPHICVRDHLEILDFPGTRDTTAGTTANHLAKQQKLNRLKTSIWTTCNSAVCSWEKLNPRSTAPTPDGDLWGEGGRMSLGVQKAQLCYHHPSSTFCHSFLCGSPNPHIPHLLCQSQQAHRPHSVFRSLSAPHRSLGGSKLLLLSHWDWPIYEEEL